MKLNQQKYGSHIQRFLVTIFKLVSNKLKYNLKQKPILFESVIFYIMQLVPGAYLGINDISKNLIKSL
jgi:hypothetical protein